MIGVVAFVVEGGEIKYVVYGAVFHEGAYSYFFGYTLKKLRNFTVVSQP